jgi:hypothetical protein
LKAGGSRKGLPSSFGEKQEERPALRRSPLSRRAGYPALQNSLLASCPPFLKAPGRRESSLLESARSKRSKKEEGRIYPGGSRKQEGVPLNLLTKKKICYIIYKKRI